MLELHYFLLGVVVLLALVYFYNELEINKEMMSKDMTSKETFITGRDGLSSVIVEKKDVVDGGIGACRPFNYGRLIVLDDPNLPLDKTVEFQTEAEKDVMANRLGKLDGENIVSSGNNVGERGARFGKKRLLFDGIWERGCEQKGLDRECKWKMTGNGLGRSLVGWDRHTVPKSCGGDGGNGRDNGTYGCSDFFHFPEKCAPIDGEIYFGDQCAGSVGGKGTAVSEKVCCYEGSEMCDDTVIQA